MFKSIFRGKKKRSRDAGKSSDSIENARVGDVFTIADLSLEYEESYFIIEQMHRYESEVGQWYELLGVDAEARLWLQWSNRGGLNVSVMTEERPMGLSRLGTNEGELFRMDEERSIDSYLTYEDSRFFYSFSGEAFYFKDDRGPGEGFYSWEFVGEDEGRLLSVVKWEGLPYQAYVIDVVSPESVNIYKS